MRYLCNHVRRLGPLWNCSAFGFESANHFLVRALSGTTKTPESLVGMVVKNRWTLVTFKEKDAIDTNQESIGMLTDVYQEGELQQKFDSVESFSDV